MKTLLFFISPFALEQKIVLIDDEDKDFFKEFSSEINSMENIGLDLLEQYDNIKHKLKENKSVTNVTTELKGKIVNIIMLK